MYMPGRYFLVPAGCGPALPLSGEAVPAREDSPGICASSDRTNRSDCIPMTRLTESDYRDESDKAAFFNRVQSQCRTLSVIECQKRSAFIFPGAAEACLSVLYMAVMGTELTLDCQVILFFIIQRFHRPSPTCSGLP